MRASKIFTNLTGIITVMVLAMGVGFGVLLVQQDQDIRKRADEAKEHKVSICHKTGSDSNSWVQIEVSDKAVPPHLEHGDIQGSCPSTGGDKDKDKDKDKGDKDNGKDEGNRGGVSLASTVNVNNATVASVEKEVETKYIYVTTQFDFRIKFQGIDTKKPNKVVRVIFRRGEEELHVYNKVEVSSNNQGIYRGVITDVKPGVYEVLIKGDGYLQRKFVNIYLKKGKNLFDWTGSLLTAGDFDQNNILNARDLAELLSYYNEDLNPVTDANRVFDVDMNDRLETSDLNIVLANFKELELKGEE